MTKKIPTDVLTRRVRIMQMVCLTIAIPMALIGMTEMLVPLLAAVFADGGGE